MLSAVCCRAVALRRSREVRGLGGMQGIIVEAPYFCLCGGMCQYTCWVGHSRVSCTALRLY
eukprot:scaffold2059_cov106-Isochrysis_galbana.AAC.6